MAEVQNILPPGWDSKVDKKTGKTFYINHGTKTTTWEDPRLRNVSFSKSSHPQSFSNDLVTQHGSPDLRRNYVYPSQSSPIPAFQIPGPKYIPLQDLGTTTRISPLLLKTSQTQDSSLTNIPDTEESVSKISAMFPTVSDTHIRLLLKKYHDRQAVVISALQVEKHPITTPGPFTTPSPARSMYPGLHSSLQITPPLALRSYSRGVSPVSRFGSIVTESSRIGDGFRNSTRPHSSPKLKLRYLKCVFPKAEETVILDVLMNSENNIQKASEWLKKMGYDRKDPAKIQKHTESNGSENEQKNEESLKTDTAQVTKLKTAEEKLAIKVRLQEQHKDIIEQVILIALDSVQYDEDRASQILQIMVQEENKVQSRSTSKSDGLKIQSVALDPDSSISKAIPTSQSRQSFKNILGTDRGENSKGNIDFSSMKNDRYKYLKSPLLAITHGHNSEIVNGPNEKLLLTEYIPWQGTNSHLSDGPKKELAKGPNKDNLTERIYQPIGPNPQLCKRVKSGLAKGSLFQQLHNVISSESRANSTYNTITGEVASAIHDVSWNSMREAGKKEIELAVQAGHVNKEGVPIITVVADGAWSKRSYRTNCNALSGVVSLIEPSNSSNLSSGDFWIGTPEEGIQSVRTLDKTDNLWSGIFVPPPPRPLFLDDSATPDGLTTCDLCSWAWQRSNTFSLEAAMEAPVEIGWVLTLTVVSVLSAVIGAVIMVIVFQCRRVQCFREHGEGSHPHENSSSSSTRPPINISDDKNLSVIPPATLSTQQNPQALTNSIWSWLSCKSTTMPSQLDSPKSTAENHYTHIDETLYTELDESQIGNNSPAYQNSAYTDSDGPSAPSSAYYSDLSVTTGTDRVYEIVDLSTQAIWENTSNSDRRQPNQSRLASISETATVLSDYV